MRGSSSFTAACAAALLAGLLAAAPAGASKLTVLYQASASDGGTYSSLYQPLPVAGGGVIVEAQGAFPDSTNGLVLLLTPPAVAGQMYTRTVLHAFNNPDSGDGGSPSGHLVADKAGNVWGMTNAVGSVTAGTLFELVAPTTASGSWTYKEVLQMPPNRGLGGGYGETVFDPAGNLYGVSQECLEGTNCAVVFEIPAATLAGGDEPVKTLLTLATPSPLLGLVRDKHGNLFGVETFGGNASYGAVWEISPPASKHAGWTAQMIHSFCDGGGEQALCPDGDLPMGTPAVNAQGALFGTTFYGGGYNSVLGYGGSGVIWTMQPPATVGGTWTFTKLYEILSATAKAPNYFVQDPIGNTLLGRNGAILGALNTGGFVTNVGYVVGGVLSYNPKTPSVLTLLAEQYFPVYNYRRGPENISSYLSMDSEGNLYAASANYYYPGKTTKSKYPVIFKIAN